MVLSSGHVLPCHGAWFTVLSTVFSQAIDPVLLITAHDLLGHWTYYTVPLWVQGTAGCATGLWIPSIPWTCYIILYWDIDFIVLSSVTCAIWLWTCLTRLCTKIYWALDSVPCATGPWNMSYCALEHIVLSHWLSGIGQSNMCYRIVDEAVAGGHCSEPWTMWYKAVYHVLLSNGIWINGSRTVLYQAIDHVVQGCVTCAMELLTMSYRTLDYIVLENWPCGTCLCTMWYFGMDTFYWVVYLIVPGHQLCTKRLWTLCYLTMRTRMTTPLYIMYQALEYIVPSNSKRGTGLCTTYYHDLGHKLPCPKVYCTRLLAM